MDDDFIAMFKAALRDVRRRQRSSVAAHHRLRLVRAGVTVDLFGLDANDDLPAAMDGSLKINR
jgi:hypothetical protein